MKLTLPSAIKKNSLPIIIAISLILPFLFSIKPILAGEIPFWYDPARDLTLALGNLHKITLIGPPSGIPSIFYGPVWIWIISLALIISKDPRAVVFLVAAVPYFTLFPFFLFKFSRLFGKTVTIALWLLFILNFAAYTTQLWSPYLAPLFFLMLIYLVVFTDGIFWAGVTAGLVISAHIAFGIGTIMGTGLFLLVSPIISIKKSDRLKMVIETVRPMIAFVMGIALIFLPTAIFELRHHFLQTKMALQALATRGAVVSLTGLSKTEIIQHFFARFATLLSLPEAVAYLLGVVALGLIVRQITSRKIKFNIEEKKLVLLMITITTGILTVYLTAKNPVWPYHFIAVEMIFLLLIGMVAKKITWIKNLLATWVIILVVTNTVSFFKSFSTVSANSSLNIEKQVVNTIAADAKNKSYSVFIYNSSIYTYDYSYVFKWLAGKEVPFDPGQIPTGSPLVYLVIPGDYKKKENFIQYRTPEKDYATLRKWTFPDGTKVFKRVKKERG